MKNRLIAAYQAKLISLFHEKFPSMKYSNMEGNIFQAILEVFYVNNLVEVKNNQVVVSSREIAKKFNKRHDHILRDLNDIKKDVPNFGEMFFETMLSDSYGRQQKVYLMTRDGFTLLAMGFTGKEALQWKLKYIAAFNEMEKQLSGKPSNLNELQVFINSEFGEIRSLVRDEGILFVAADVCRALGLNDTSKAVSRLDGNEKGTTSIRTLGGKQNMLIVNEYGLYKLVLASRKPEAKAFKRWITHEVIPSIRKTGGYRVGKDASDEARLKRLDIMDRNSRTRAANLLLRIAERTKNPEYREVCHAKAAEILSGTPVLPKPVANRKKTYSAAEIGEMFDDLVPAIETLLG